MKGHPLDALVEFAENTMFYSLLRVDTVKRV